jgi:hypothetical protein
MHTLFIDYFSSSSIYNSVYCDEMMLTGKSVVTFKEAVEFCRSWLLINHWVKTYRILICSDTTGDSYQITDIWNDECVVQGFLQI